MKDDLCDDDIRNDTVTVSFTPEEIDHVRKRIILKNWEEHDKSKNERKDILNSPFIITLLGGILTSLIGTLLQYQYNDYQQSRDEYMQLQTKRVSLVASASKRLDSSMTILMSYKHNIAEMNALTQAANEIKSGKSRLTIAETKQLIEISASYDYYVHQCEQYVPKLTDGEQPASILLEIQAIYDTNVVNDDVYNLIELVTTAQGFNPNKITKETVATWKDRYNRLSVKLFRDMGNEIHNQKDNKPHFIVIGGRHLL